MHKIKFPLYYYLILLILLLLAVCFWILIFIPKEGEFVQSNSSRSVTNSMSHEENQNQASLPENISEISSIDTTKIIVDAISNRRIINNLVNIALKNGQGSILTFANDLKKHYFTDDYKIVYVDAVINRLQIQLPEDKRMEFKNEVKTKLSQYKLLVWDEALFKYGKTFTDPKLKDQKANWYLKSINIGKAWDQSTGTKDIIIAVIDNGFDLNHPELKDKAVKPYNVIDRSADVSPADINHGTHVASIIVANANNGEGVAGICPDCSLMPIKVQDANGIVSGTYVIDAILYAIKNKASVINLSLGMQQVLAAIPTEEQKKFINSGAKDEEEFWNDLFAYANEKNVTCVLASGNSNMLTGFDPFQRSKFTIKVGAVDEKQMKASFSNYGRLTTIYAPGTNIFGAKPGNGFETLQGTSMAAPIIAGIIGLIKSENRNLKTEAIIKIIDKNSTTRNGIKTFYFKHSLQ